MRHVQHLLPLVAALATAPHGDATNTTPERVDTVIVNRGAQDPAVSPDGSQIAVSILGRIWLVPIAGGNAQPVTSGLGWDRHPAWSPDGRFLAYAHELPSGSNLVAHNLATGTSGFLYETTASIGSIAYSPAGGELFFVLDRSQYDAHVWRVPTAGGQAEQVTFTDNWHEWSFAPSPDGADLFLESGRYGGADLYLLHLDGFGVTRLTDSPRNEFSVAWSRDGRTRVNLEETNGADTVVVQPVAGGARRRFGVGLYDEKQLALDPTGTFAVLSTNRQLARLDLATGAMRPIPFRARFPLADRGPASLVITGARVFTATGTDTLLNATVIVRDGRISEIRSGSGGPLPAGVPVIEAGGKTLLPGLMDNHYHYWSAATGQRLLRRGITSVRDPGSAVASSLNFKDAINLGLLPGPHIYTAGPLIDGLGGYHPMVDVELADPAAAPALVRALKAEGVDLLKVYFMLEPDVLRAVIREAKAVGLPVTGHIGVRTSWRVAMEAGISGFNHVRVWRDVLPLDLQPQGEDESLDGSKNPIARMQADWSRIDPDGEAARGIIAMMAATHTALDPTLAIQRIGDESRRRFGLDEFAVARQSSERMGRFVRNAEQAGVVLLAGTDNRSLFDELEAYAAAGIPAADILRAATVNGAAWLGKGGEFGTIQVGRRADLLLVDGNPLQDLKNLRNVVLVVQDGRIVFEK